MEVKFIPHRTAAKNAQSTEKSSRRRYGQAWRRARRKFFMVERAPSADGGRGLSAGSPGSGRVVTQAPRAGQGGFATLRAAAVSNQLSAVSKDRKARRSLSSAFADR